MSTVFAYWSPKLYNYYVDTVQKLRGNDPSLVFNFSNSIFACATYNFGPETVTVTHLDYLNYIAGWCGITNFVPSSLIPSAYLQHSNTAIPFGETRYLFTQYTAGAIFRYIEDGFRMRTQMSEEEQKEAEEKQRERITIDLNMYSTIPELKKMYGL
ncbi:hypothetical protein K435DRAFT_823280 [Dendrothele bispora CBS 962.96]|uniref:Uncharacterized protein n=1 Tax=Dendrothele bispora (strain CBS 962.96) TaxID=1314807 RepID=A0A4S8L166_DENBC|nr:hypothetical protein K435DRAFT_823280 [Dendrothele bispora CBS 962.96]